MKETDVLWDRRSQLWWWISGQKFHQAAAFTCLTSPVTERQRRETEGSVRVRVRACVCVYKSQVTPVPADGARAGLSQESSVCVRDRVCVCVRARQDVREAGQKQDDTFEEETCRVSQICSCLVKNGGPWTQQQLEVNLKLILTADFTVSAVIALIRAALLQRKGLMNE